MKAVIVADIISSTSFPVAQLMAIQEELKQFVDEQEKWFQEQGHVFWGRVVRGDTLECYMDDAHYALRVALLLKLRILLHHADSSAGKQQKKNGIRVAIGVGEMRVTDPVRDILDGEAIYLAGRELDGQHTAGKEKVSIKRTLFYASPKREESRSISLMLECVDLLLRKATDTQRVVIYNKLLGKKEAEIAKMLGKSIPTVNSKSVLSGWNAISDIVNYYEKEIYPL